VYGSRDAPGVDRDRAGLSKRRAHGADGSPSGQHVVHDDDPPAPKSGRGDERAGNVPTAFLGPEPDLRACVSHTSHGTFQGLEAEHACGTPGNLRRLVEAPLRMTAGVKRDRHHAVHIVMQPQRAD